MGIFAPAEITANYVEIGAKKASAPPWRLILLGILAGFLIGMGAAVTNTATHSISNVSVARVLSGLLFPFGLGMVMLLGAELFTGNCMLPISVLEGKATLKGVFMNWGCVYAGNLAGGLLLAAGCAFFGQLNYSGGELALYTIKVAASKCALPFGNAFVMGVLCNLLVCAGVLCALSAKDTTGKILGSYIPVAFFVLCGFEHCVANMFYIPAGLFALSVPRYAQLAAQSSLDTGMLTWGGFLFSNLLPVTLGNMLGGVSMGLLMWVCYVRKAPKSKKG